MSLASAATVLDLFRRHRKSIGVAELASELGWPKSSCSRILKDMAELGLLERDRTTRRYRIGLMMLELGRWYRAGDPLIEAADALMANVTRETGHSSSLVALDGTEVIVLRSWAGSHQHMGFRQPGNRGAASATSTGRCLLARLPDTEIARRFTPFPPGPHLPRAPHELSALMTRIRRVRETGFEVSVNEYIVGVAGVSVAAHDPGGGAPVALNVIMPSARTTPKDRIGVARLLLEVSGRLTAQFGNPPGAAIGEGVRNVA
jgi:DNA-binding IclR family transcriptional regulator